MNNLNLNSREKFLARMRYLQKYFPELVQDLENHEKGIVDRSYYWQRILAQGVSGKQDLIRSSDTDTFSTTNPVLTNVNNAKLEKEELFLVTGIVLTIGEPATSQVILEKLANANLDVVTPAIAAGKVEAKTNNDRVILPESGIGSFFRTSDNVAKSGLYELSNPQFIRPEQMLKFTVDLPLALEQDTVFRLEYIGASVYSAKGA